MSGTLRFRLPHPLVLLLFGVAVAAALTAIVAAMPLAWLPQSMQPASVFPISWLWYGPVGCVLTLILGYTLSLARPAPQMEKVAELTYS